MTHTQFLPGQRVTWLHTPRGGYGYVIPVDAEVAKVGPKRVQILVRTKTGDIAVRWVEPANLRERNE